MVAGAAAGNKLKNMQLESNETEMQNLQAASDTADTKSLRSAAAKNNESKVVKNERDDND